MVRSAVRALRLLESGQVWEFPGGLREKKLIWGSEGKFQSSVRVSVTVYWSEAEFWH